MLRYKLIFGVLVFELVGFATTQRDADAHAEDAPPPGTVETSDRYGVAKMAATQITDEYMREIIAELSSDEYEGRGPASKGDEKARLYLASKMLELGLEPGGKDGNWEQPFDLVLSNASQPATWVFEKGGVAETIEQHTDFIVASGVRKNRVSIESREVVFVGYGIQASEFGWDDYKGANLKNKVLLMMNNDPDWDPAIFAGNTRLRYGRWDYKFRSAAEQGAAGVIIIHTNVSAGYPFQVVQTSLSGNQFALFETELPESQVNAWVTEEAARKLVAVGGHDLDSLRKKARDINFEPISLGVSTSIAMEVRMERVRSANVLGLIRGSDPDLRNEAVIYTAHHDHLGVGRPNAEGDDIYNGALDNATGVASVMAIAKALSALPKPPRRSVLIAFVGAEERGLLGSEWYAQNPTFPPGKIAANLNYDTGNVLGRTYDVTFVGWGKSDLDQLVTFFAEKQGRVVKADPRPDAGAFYRSDQFSFAKIGVPAVYLRPGSDFRYDSAERSEAGFEHRLNTNYHQPSDEYDQSWNLDGMVEDAQLGFYIGLAIANTDAMPAWNSGDEFEEIRLDAFGAEED